MAGDEAAMTRGLQENFKGFELISNIPGMKAFFPFVRTGFNYLDVTFQHTPLQIFRDKYYDIKQLADSPNPSQQLLNKYGIRAQDAQYELALMEGRMAMGTSIIGLASLAADSSPELSAALDCNNNNLTEVGTVSGNNLQIDFGTL